MRFATAVIEGPFTEVPCLRLSVFRIPRSRDHVAVHAVSACCSAASLRFSADPLRERDSGQSGEIGHSLACAFERHDEN